MKASEVDFEGFKAMAQPPKKSWTPPMPSMASKPSPRYGHVRAIFDNADLDKDGKLDKKELEQALKEMEKTAEEIKKELDSMKGDHMDFEEFRKIPLPAIPTKEAGGGMCCTSR